MDYHKFLDNYTKSGKKVTDLSRAKTLMNVVGDPQDSLKFVHIAGTNGKGSVAEMTAAALTAAGYKTGLFTSPFIVRYNDRIRIDGREATDSELEEIFGEIAFKVNDLPPDFSRFEITQAAAMLYFSRQKCDVVVLEAGLGGTLDSTNVIKPPLVSVICSVSLDHTAILGETVDKIAKQKAGIIKPGSPSVLSADNPYEAVSVVSERAEKCGSPLTIPDKSLLEVVNCTAFGSKVKYKGEEYSVSMGGAHQITNALTVIETLEILKEKGFDRLGKNAVSSGLSAAIPARVQTLSKNPLVILDGAHNPDGIKALAAALGSVSCKKRAVIGMLGDKDSETAARFIADCADRFVCVDDFYPAAKKADELAALLRSCGANAYPSPLGSVETVKREFSSLEENEALVICGSLYLAALFTDKEKNKNIFIKGSAENV
ncbi:MAG: bifunctional folylpolyglutamate synthase/dihydrofolate synthase [Oscillospiraceae bacterium]